MDSPAKGHALADVYEFAKCLLDLLQDACNNRQAPLSPVTVSDNARTPLQKQKDHAVKVTPISLCMHLVSATAACYQQCDISADLERSCHEENDRIMSKIPHDVSTWSIDLLSHLQLLIVQAIIALCCVGLETKSDLQEFIQHDNAQALIKVVRSVMKSGGLITEDSQESSDIIEINVSRTNGVPCVEISSPAKRASAKTGHNGEFVAYTLKNLFTVISSSIAPALSASPGQVTDVVSMLQEFDHCGGYDVFEKVVRVFVERLAVQGGTDCGDSGSKQLHSPRSKADSTADLSPGGKGSKSRLRFSSVQAEMEQCMKQLLKSWEDLLRLLKRAKTEYLHQVTCTKRSHRRCDLASVVHHHHDIIGVGFSKYCRLVRKTKKHTSKMRWGLQSAFSGQESPKTKAKNRRNLRPNDDLPPVCVVMTALKFLVQKLLPLSEAFSRSFVASIDRIGVCHCSNPGYILVPLLSYLPSMKPSTQDIVLAVSGRLLLQRAVKSQPKVKKQEKSSHDEEEGVMPDTVELSDAITTVQILHFAPNSVRTSDESTGNMKSSNPDSPRTGPESSKPDNVLVEDQDHPWLCLSVYKSFLCGKHDTVHPEISDPSQQLAKLPLAVRVARHLASVAPHFELCQALNLLTTVLLPVLRFATAYVNVRCKGSKLKLSRKRRNVIQTEPEVSTSAVNFKHPQKLHPEVISCCLQILRHHLAKSPKFRRAFVRHSCLKPVTTLLLTCQTSHVESAMGDSEKLSLDSTWDGRSCNEISKLSRDVLCALLTNSTMLSQKVETLHLRMENGHAIGEPQNINSKIQDCSDDDQDEGVIGSFFKGLSRFSPKQQRHSVPFGSRTPDRKKRSGTETPPWMVRTVDEVAVFDADVTKFVGAILQTISDLATSADADLPSARARQHPRSLPSQKGEVGLDGTLSSSDTTGYHSRDSSFQLDDLSDEEVGPLDLDPEGVCLPVEDKTRMKDLCDLCSLLSLVLQKSLGVQDTFGRLGGFEMVLRLLTLVTTSLVPVNSRLDFTSASSEASPNRSLLHSLEEQSKLRYRSLGDTAEASASSEPKSILSSTPNETSFSLDLEQAMESFAGDTSKELVSDSSKGEDTLKSDPPSSKITSECQLDEGMMDLKFQLLSSTLIMALLGSDIDEEHDITSDDIISTLKPLLQQSELAGSKYCLAMCRCLFEAAVRSRNLELAAVNMDETMTSLKQQVSSPRRMTPSPGHQRYSTSQFPYDTPIAARRSERRRLDSQGSESNISEADDNSSVYDMMLNIDRVLDSDEEMMTDGYQGDSESDRPDRFNPEPESDGISSPMSALDLVRGGSIEHPKLITLMFELLGTTAEKFEQSSKNQLPSPSAPVGISQQEYNNNVRAVARTITFLLKHSPDNLEVLLTGCDLPLACLESFKSILQNNTDKEQDIRQNLLEVCLALNKRRMTARHLRLVLSFFNSEDPPLRQLLHYLLLLIQHQLPGPSQFLQFPVPDIASTSGPKHPTSESTREENIEPYSASVWKVAPLRLQVGSRVMWPASNVGVTVSLWLHVGGISAATMDKEPAMQSWDAARIVVVDIDHTASAKSPHSEHGSHPVSSPYNHLVSIGTKQSMLQVWLDQATLIFRVCVDPEDHKPVGVLAQTDCDGLVLCGEWQHLTFTYTENKLPDKTILGKVHVIANCTIERDVILEHNLPKQSGRMTSSYRRRMAQEPRDVNLFVGHLTRQNASGQLAGDDSGYKLGPVMLFDGIHFSLKSAFAIFSKGPNVNNLTDCLVSDSDCKNDRKSSASVSSRVRFSSSCSQVCSTLSSPLSPTPEASNSSHCFLLPHSLLLSDLVPEEFFSGENVPDIRNLQEHLVLSHSPTDPGHFLLSHINTGTRETDQKRKSFSLFSSLPTSNETTPSESFDPLTQQCIRMPVKKLARVRSQWNRGLHRALNQVGGMQVFLLLSAKVIEVTSHSIKNSASPEELRSAERTQCLALQGLLQLRSADSKRQLEFSSQNVAAMLHKLLTKSQCIVGFRTLQILLNSACSGDVVIENLGTEEDEDHYQVNFDNSAIIRDQELLQVFLADWRVWHKSRDVLNEKGTEDGDFPVWSMLMHSLLSLVREEHHYHWFNMRALLRAGIVQKILTGLQQMITDGITPFPGPSVTSPMMELLRAVIGSPPDTHILTKICDFLVATHPPAGTFVCHSSSSFYFNLQSAGRQKESWASNPTSPTEKTSEDIRPSMNRSVSAPVGPTHRMVNGGHGHQLNGSFHQVEPSFSQHGASRVVLIEESTADDKVKRDKALSIIEEAQSSESTHSSRNSTPARSKPSTPVPVKMREKVASQTDAAFDASKSWEEVPHSVVPVDVPPSPQRSPPQSAAEPSTSTPTSCPEKDVRQPSLPQRSSKSEGEKEVMQPSTTEDDGMSYITCELLNLLFVAVMTMPDKSVQELTSGPLHAGTLIVGVHHESSKVRTMAVRMLAAYFSRCSEVCQDEFIKQKGFHLVANQLHQHQTTRPLVDACLYFLLGHPASCAEMLPLDGSAPDPGMLPTPAPDPFTNHAAVLLLAVLENSTHDFELSRDLVARLLELFECMGPVADVMLDNGLTLALCNLITAVVSQACVLNALQKEDIIKEVQHFMTCIAVKACVTAGSAHFQVFEDLFTLLYVIEKDQARSEARPNSENVSRIQAISFHILSMVLELMQKTTGGKSPAVPRSLDLMPYGLPLESSGARTMSTRSRMSSSVFSRQSSWTQSAIQEYAYHPDDTQDHDNGLASPDVEYPPTFPSPHRGSMSVDLTNSRPDTQLSSVKSNKFHKRSLSGSHSMSHDNSIIFRPHGGGLRTRSFKGSQRRRINEAETARRLQRVVMIAVDKIVYSDQKITAPNLSDKDATFATDVPPDAGEQRSEKIEALDENLHSFVLRIYDKLLDWLSTVVAGNSRAVLTRSSTSSRISSTSSSSRTSNLKQGWERILNISRDSLIDQTVRLFTFLLSPLQPDLRLRNLPLSLVRKQPGERILAVLFPKDSKNGRKVSVYIYYLLCYYKQQMTSQEKKDAKMFCRQFHRCGHRLYPLPQTANGVSAKDQKRRSSVSLEKSASETQVALMDTIEKNQGLFDSERKRDVQNWCMQNNASYMQLKLRTDHLSQIVSQHAMDVTQHVVLRQNIERKKMIAHMKDVISNDLAVRKQWAGLLEQLAHERAVWYDARRYPKSWQLDSTEGPNRERRRLQRCHLGIEERFMMKKTEKSKRKEIERKKDLQRRVKEMVEDNTVHEDPVKEEEEEVSLLNKRPLSFLFEDDSHSSDSITIRTRLQTNERISMVQSCINVTTSCETPGEILIGESSMYFVGDQVISDLSLTQALFGECEVLVLSWRHEEVAEVHRRWWQLQDIAIEIFLTNGKTYLLAFRSMKDRDIIVNQLSRSDLPNLLVQDCDIHTLTQMWRNGIMTNFEYLTQLNKSAGRSFNDLMQYPVMPFVLADYTSAMLDLNNLDSFRNLHRPISVPDDTRMKHYKDRYKFLMDDYNNCTEDERELKTAPFHYGSHYSNSGTVLHFLVRLPPYTQMFLEYQDASFDIPDRTFHSMETTYRLSSYSSTTDVKELVPEFFFLPEFLCNLEGFDFGLRQCGLRVNHVILPPWSKADPRLFVLIHRQALESDYVSANLHGWVDLVFGYKQTGKEAIDAVNVFHPATYFGMDISSVDDPVKRKALETMVKTYGQTPKQLFTSPHPNRLARPELKEQAANRRPNGSRKSSLVPSGRSTPIMDRSAATKQKSSPTVEGRPEITKASQPQRPLSSVLGLKWGMYLGSPSAPEPAVFLHKTLSDPAGSLIPLQTNDVCALAPRMGLLVIYNRERGIRSFKSVDIRWSALLTYGHPDNIVRLKMRKTLPDVNLLRTPADDHVTCCAVAPDCRAIVLGHRSGAISVNRCNPQPDKSFDLELLRGTTLYGHVSDITCLVACGEFRILASGSRDGTAVLWDLDALSYIRSLTGHATAVSSMAISRTSGDICTVCDSGNDEGSHIRLWTINGSLLAAQDTKRRVGCVTFSSAPEGISVNVIAGGMSNGVIRLWSSWDLTPIRDIEPHGVDSPITCVTFTHNSKVLYAATSNGLVIGWCFKDRLEEKQPMLISFLNVCEKG